MTAIRSCAPDPDPCRRVAVLGAGPAGLSAALWLKHLGLSPVVIESLPEAGGMQQLNFLRNDWVLGQMDLTGPELCERFVQHITAAGVPVEYGCAPLSITAAGAKFAVEVIVGINETLTTEFRAIVIATGLRYRGNEVLAEIPGFATLATDDVVYGPRTFLDMERHCEKTILIVGGGDNAFENAHFLLKAGARVVLVCRSLPRAQTRLLEAVRCATSGWMSFTQARIERFVRQADGIGVEVKTGATTKGLHVDKIHVLAGYTPNTCSLESALGPLFGSLALDSAGYLKVDEWGRTSVPGIYAAGDVCNPEFPNVVSAIALGAKAAKAIEIDSRIDP